MTDIALVTCSDIPNLPMDEWPVVTALQKKGLTVQPVIWDDHGIDWSTFRLVVIRSTWDYVKRHEAFSAWADWVGSVTSLCNPADVVKWNTRKTYLSDLGVRGVRVVESEVLEAGGEVDLAGLMSARGWVDVVIKPVIGAGANESIRVRSGGGGGGGNGAGDDDGGRGSAGNGGNGEPSTGAKLLAGYGDWNPAGMKSGGPKTVREGQDHLNKQLSDTSFLVQLFLPAVLTEGELSFLYIDGELSHAIRKIPQSGDYRSQEEYSSKITAYKPSDSDREFADHVVRAANQHLSAKGSGVAGATGDAAELDGKPLLYTRVDAVIGDDSRLRLIELELIEPALYLGFGDGAADRVAAAIARRV